MDVGSALSGRAGVVEVLFSIDKGFETRLLQVGDGGPLGSSLEA